MNWLMKPFVWFEEKRHWITEWFAVAGVGIGIFAVALGAQPAMLWLSLVVAYILQLQLLWDLKKLKAQHTKDLQKAFIDRLKGRKER